MKFLEYISVGIRSFHIVVRSNACIWGQRLHKMQSNSSIHWLCGYIVKASYLYLRIKTTEVRGILSRPYPSQTIHNKFIL